MLLRSFVVSILCTAQAALFAAPQQSPATHKSEKFKPFTGKVIANKVRIRAKPDLESHIIRQAVKDDLFLIVGESADFYEVAPPKDTKAYVFRSYILDGVVEANRVNVRLEPHIDAPVIGQLQSGEKVKGQVSVLNHKWLEISPPKDAKFYVSKEYVVNAGGPEYLSSMEKRKVEVEEILSKALSAAALECKKTYEEMDPEQSIAEFETILKNYLDFPSHVTQAKEALALLKETYLNKKIAFLEERAELTPSAKNELISKHRSENRDLYAGVAPNPKLFEQKGYKKVEGHTSHFWNALEESLFVSWSSFHPNKKLDDFYKEQEANATVITGVIEPYAHQVKDKPGDYLLKKKGVPLAYVYSTQVNLQSYLGKEITVVVSPRPNNHFAFPAYFVLAVE